jgi:DNA-binding transcriptional LysR family regulator
MELRHLRYFVAVAEELHFTRAAKRLGIRQPPLSAQIQQLEAEMGTALFRRLPRGVQLMPSGKLFLEEARRILEQLEQAKVGAQRGARGERGQMVVGFAGATYFDPTILSMISGYRSRYPEVVLLPDQRISRTLVARLEAGEVDVAFVRYPSSEGGKLLIETLVDEDLMIALPGEHELAQQRSVSLASLAKEPFIQCSRKLNVPVFEEFIAACSRAGFTPILGPEAPDVVSIVPLVAAGFGVALVPRALSQIRIKGVAYRPLGGERLALPIRLAYRSDNDSPPVRNFVKLARRVAGASN